ncbi:MAG: hypothetical protein ACSLFM_13170 [Tepidiformaceae bacterium]
MPVGHSGGFLDVLADGQECGEIRFDERAAPPDDEGNQILALDRTTVDPACATAGSTVTFVTGEGRVLAARLTVQPGSDLILDSLDPEMAVPGGPTWFAVPRGMLEFAPIANVASLSIRAGAVTCGSLSLVSPVQFDSYGDPMLPLTGECARTGTRLTVIDDKGRQMFRHPVVITGGRVMLAGLGPEAPSTGSPASTPGAPAAGNGTVAEPGEAGTDTVALATLGALLVLAGVGGLAVARRWPATPRRGA